MNKIYSSIVALVAVAILVFLAWYFSNIVAYILIAAVLSLIGKPLVNLCCKIRIGHFQLPKWAAALMTLAAIFAIVVGGLRIFVPIIFNKLAEFSSFDVAGVMENFREPIAGIERFIREHFSIDENFSLTGLIAQQIGPLFSVDHIGSIIASLPVIVKDFAVGVFAVLFLTFFFLKEDTLFYDGVAALFPERYEENARHALSEVNTLLIRYFIGICIEMFIKLVIITTGLVLIGLQLQNALLIALIAAVLNVIPYIGPWLGAIIGIFIGTLTPVDGMTLFETVMAMGLLFAGFQITDDIVLQPYIYSSSVKAHPVEIFLVILLAGSMAGIVGMLFAIPGYTVLRVFAKEFFNRFKLVQRLTEKI
jgi:predicted PurR-regulated permease PerM